MKKLFYVLLIIFIAFNTSIFAQKPDGKPTSPPAQVQQQVPNVPTFQATLIVEDIVFAAGALGTAEISGSEVDMYLQCKSSLQSVIKHIQTNNIKNSDSLTLTFQMPVAQALVGFLSKSKFLGSQVENYRRFIEVIVSSSKNAKLPEQKK